MKESALPLRLSLSSLLPTSFPALEQAVAHESSVRMLPFSDFLDVASLIEEVAYERRRALSLLSTFRDADNRRIAESIKTYTDDTLLSPHASAYLLYLVGAYAEASEVVERTLQRVDSEAYARIAAFCAKYVAAVDESVTPLVGELAARLPVLERAVRAKRPASVLAKLTSQHLRNRARGVTLADWLSVPLALPYDLVGCRLIVEPRKDSMSFDDLVSVALTVCRLFADRESVQVHRRYSMRDMDGASILFEASSVSDPVPVQVQLWNVSASRYEWLCHGNHKINHNLSPLLPTWASFCDRPINRYEYANAVARRWSVC